jgi:hypothetical protein
LPTHRDQPQVREVSVSAGAVRHNRRAAWRRAFTDFAAVPLLVLLAFAVLALVSTVADHSGFQAA